MKKIIVLLLLISFNPLSSEPIISYLIPDIGTPGMATYVEIIGPFNPDDPNASSSNFRNDGFDANNKGSLVEVRCLNPVDESKITFGPIIISWGGRMISTQVFVHPNVKPNSADWEELAPEFRIPIVVETNDGVSNVDTFYIVTPWDLGDVSSVSESDFGNRNRTNLGKRSRRGAMIVNSLALGNKGYTVSTIDCDPGTPGNQGYLPFILISKGNIMGGPQTSINVDGQSAENGHGGNGGPGGGGGGGKFCDVVDEGDNGGYGFVSGGRGGLNSSGIPFIDDKFYNYGQGSGANGYSLNGVYPPKNPSSNFEASGGGTGHPFGKSGIGTGDGGLDNPEGGYGGGSGFRQVKDGGSGGYATQGANSKPALPTTSVSGGKTHGNKFVVPIAGGSGGGSGNPQSMSDCSGSGSGGGGAIKVFAPYINNLALKSNGAAGKNGTNDEEKTRGGSGSGGHTGLCTKLPITDLIMEVQGGKDDAGIVTGGAGRMRYDIPFWTNENINIPDDASHFRGPTTDNSQFVKRQFRLTGSCSDERNMFVYIRPESGDWKSIASVFYDNNDWYIDVDLSVDDYCNDSLFYLVAFQGISDAVGDIVTHDIRPEYVMSQSATNILRVIPDIQGDTDAEIRLTICEGNESDSVVVEIENVGGPGLELDFENAYFDSPTNGLSFNGFELVNPTTASKESIASCSSLSMTVKYTYQPGHVSPISSILYIPHNDNDEDRTSPWEIAFNVVLDTFALQAKDILGNNLDTINVLDMGEICKNSILTYMFKIVNNSTIAVDIEDIEFVDDNGLFSGFIVNTNLLKGDETDAGITFDGADVIGQYKTRVYIKPLECEFAIDSFDVIVNVVESDIIFEESAVAIDTLNFGQVKVGISKAIDVVITNKGDGPAYIERDSIKILLLGQTEFKIVNDNLPITLINDDGSELIITIEYTPTDDVEHSATLTISSGDDIDTPIPNSCSGQWDLILLGEGIRSNLKATIIDFGLVADCEGIKRDTIKVTNNGAASVQIISDGEIVGADANYFELVNPPSSPYTLNNGDTSYYFIEFDTSIPPIGQKSATFILETDDGEILPVISADIESLDISVVPKTISFGDVPVPQTWDSDFIVTNSGSFDIVIEKIIVNDPLVSVSPSANNQSLLSGTSLTYTAQVNFIEFREIDATISVVISDPCVDTLFITIQGTGLKGEYIVPPIPQFKDIAFCESDTVNFTLTNIDDPVIEILSMVILEEDDWQFFSLLGVEPNNLILNKDETYSRQIRFAPDNTTEGDKTAKLRTIIKVNALEDTVVSVLQGKRSSGILALPQTVDFGDVIITSKSEIELTLNNDGARDVTIEEILALAKFSDVFTVIPDQITFPKVVQIGNTFKLMIEFIPKLVMQYEDTLRLSISNPCTEELLIVLRGNGIPAKFATVMLPNLKLKPTLRNYRIPLIMKFDEAGESLSDISFKAEISFDSKIFYPTGVSNNAELLGNNVDADGKRTIEISASNISINDTDSVLAEIIGSTLLYDVDRTIMTWDTLEWTMSSVMLAPREPVDGEIELIICREGQDRLLLSSNPIMLFTSPNPASERINIKGTVLETGFHKIELLNIQGKSIELANWNVGLKSNKDFDYDFETKELNNGIYYIVLRTPARVKVIPVFILK